MRIITDRVWYVNYDVCRHMINLRGKTLLIISPHPDDEVLGCGGLIQKVKQANGKVYVIFVTVGNTKDYRKEGVSTERERIKEIESVAAYLKYDDYRILFPGDAYHLQLDKMSQFELMSAFENGSVSLNKIKPDIVTVPLLSDYNQDHRASTMALFAAARPAPDGIKPLQKCILGYESVPTAGWWDSANQNMNVFFPLTDEELQGKTHALSLYSSQVRTGNHPRALDCVKRLAHYQGIGAGVAAAEAYYGYRLIV